MADNPLAPETFSGNVAEHVRKVAKVVNLLQKGFNNNSFKIALTGGTATSTDIVRSNATAQQHANLSPISSAAAVDFALGTTWAEAKNGSVTIHHAAGSTAREYGVVLTG